MTTLTHIHHVEGIELRPANHFEPDGAREQFWSRHLLIHTEGDGVFELVLFSDTCDPLVLPAELIHGGVEPPEAELPPVDPKLAEIAF